MLSQDKIDIIKETVPVLKENGVEITSTFYKIMFEKYPQARSMFNMDKQKSGEQPKASAMTILADAQNIDNLEVLLPAIRKIGLVHVNSNVKPEHYLIVGENLLSAIKEVLGDAATDGVLGAWADAYNIIADIFINEEKVIYSR